MIVVIAKVTVKAEKKTELLELAQPLIAATRQEAGCVSYNLLDDRFDPNRCVFVEEWTDKAALAAHLQSAHILKWRQQSKDLLVMPSVLTLYEGMETKL